jgi:hypothetical protein
MENLFAADKSCKVKIDNFRSRLESINKNVKLADLDKLKIFRMELQKK